MKDIIGLIISFIGIIGVMFLAYYSTKWIARTQKFNVKSKYMEIVDKVPLGQNQSLLIVEINHKFYVVSSTEKEVQIIQELEGFIKDETPVEQLSFKDILTKVESKIGKNTNRKEV